MMTAKVAKPHEIGTTVMTTRIETMKVQTPVTITQVMIVIQTTKNHLKVKFRDIIRRTDQMYII